MAVKRPSQKADPAALERAVAMRRGGSTYDEIVPAVGITRAALCVHFKKVGLAGIRGASGAAEEQVAGDEARADQMAATLDVVRSAIHRQAKLLRRSEVFDAHGVAALARAMAELGKLDRLYRGAPTSHTKTENAGAAEPPVGAEAARALRLLDDPAAEAKTA